MVQHAAQHNPQQEDAPDAPDVRDLLIRQQRLLQVEVSLRQQILQLRQLINAADAANGGQGGQAVPVVVANGQPADQQRQITPAEMMQILNRLQGMLVAWQGGGFVRAGRAGLRGLRGDGQDDSACTHI